MLTRSQIEILKEYPRAMDWEELPSDAINKLIEIKDSEVLRQDVNRFLFDQFMSFSWTDRSIP